MDTLTYFLPQVWFGVLGLFLFLYVMLDGFDLGVGILSLTSSDDERRGLLMTSLSNVWDANETWLVLMGGGLFGAFPRAYGTILSSLYIPIFIMVFGFVFRGVAFEFREQSNRKLFWNYAFGVGSFAAALGQGFALGAVLAGIDVDKDGYYIGGVWDWLTWQSVIVALTLIQGYVLIGSTYLVWKTEGELQETHFKTAKISAWTTLLGAIFITISTPILLESARSRLFEPPLVFIFALIPFLGILLVSKLLTSIDRKQERAPFIWTILLFVLSFIGLGLIVFPYIIPPKITIYEASADPSSLVIMIIFIGFLIPVMLFTTSTHMLCFEAKWLAKRMGNDRANDCKPFKSI